MKKLVQLTSVTTVLAILLFDTATTASAFQAKVTPDLKLRVTHGQVLGDDDTAGTQTQKTMSAEEYKKFEADYIKSKNISPEQVKQRDERVAAERSKSGKSGVNPILPSQSVEDKKIRMSVEAYKGKMEIFDKKSMSSPSSKREKGTTSGTDANNKPNEQFEDRFVKLELINAANRPQATSPGEVLRPDSRPRGVDPDLINRNVIIQTPPSQENPSQLEIESRNMRGLVQPGSNVTVDPRTNEITITNKQGEERVLLRLPDQAFQDMTSQGVVFPENYDEAKANLTIQTTEDGKVVYRTEVTNQRRLFGLLPYQVKVAHEVDDETGEVLTQELPDQSFFGRFRRLIGQ